MKRRIAALLLSAIMCLGLWTPIAPAMAVVAASYESTQLKVTASVGEAHPGDTIDFTITMGPVSDMGSMQMVLDIPEGLSYVEGSGRLAEGLRETLGYDTADWTEISKMINGVASAADYESDTDTVLGYFQCRVDEETAGEVNVGLTRLEFYSCQTWIDHTERFSVVPAAINIGQAPVPATGIQLNKDSITLIVGASGKLIAEISPEDSTDEAVWSSDDADIAQVEQDGTVYGIKEGKTTITVTAGAVSDSCEVTVEKAPCLHSNLEVIKEKESTCVAQGWDSYKQCLDCGVLFSTDDAQLEEVPYRPLGDHVGGTPTCTEQAVCTVCKEPYGAFASHAWSDTYLAENADAEKHYHVCLTCETKDEGESHIPGPEATEYNDQTCIACGYIIESATGHIHANHLTYHEKVGETCTVDGSKAYYACDCGKYFVDGNATEEILQEIEAWRRIPATGHIPEMDDGDCTTAINCSVCEEVVTPGNPNHTGGAATCTEQAICEVCGTAYGELAAHTWSNTYLAENADAYKHYHICESCGAKDAGEEHIAGPEATETAPQVCTVCNYIIAPVLDHEHKGTKVEGKKASCTEDGSKPYYACACGKYFEEESCAVEIKENINDWKRIPATGHTPNPDDGDCTTAINCSVCNEIVVAARPAHVGGTATCIERAQCEVCGTTYGELADHAWTDTYVIENSDKDKHYHVCEVCEIKDAGETHVPGPAATEFAPQVCVVCSYELAPALEHVHEFDTKKNDDADHWLECRCGEKTQIAPHIYENVLDDTCDDCGYVRVVDASSVDSRLEFDTVTGIVGTEYDTPEKVEEKISQILTTISGYVADNILLYDVKLQLSLDNGQSWINATEENLPRQGITVTLPYPEGTGKATHDFVVVHMFSVTSDRLGTIAGQTEQPTVTKTQDGLKVTLKGLSPVGVAWKTVQSDTGTGNPNDDKAPSPTPPAIEKNNAINQANQTVTAVANNNNKPQDIDSEDTSSGEEPDSQEVASPNESTHTESEDDDNSIVSETAPVESNDDGEEGLNLWWLLGIVVVLLVAIIAMLKYRKKSLHMMIKLL